MSFGRISSGTPVDRKAARRPQTVSALRGDAATASIIAIGLVLFPSVVWIRKAQWVWPWDEADYAEVALKIHHAASDGPLAWLRALIAVPDSRAPLLPWLAQASTLLIDVLGSPERAL